MASTGRVSITIEPGAFESVVLRREGVAVGVLTRRGPQEPPAPPWVPPPIPPPARALRVALVDGSVESVLGTSLEDLRVFETASLDVNLAEASGPGATVLITIHGTNLVDFDDEQLARQLGAAAQTGADVVIRLIE